MATLSKHGKEIGRIECIEQTRAYMSDGNILKNDGGGWKLWKKIKPGVDMNEHFIKMNNAHKTKLENNPALAEFRKEIIELACLSKRWKLMMGMRYNLQDPDGIWSDCCDGLGDNLDLSIDEVVHLCRLYEAVLLEVGNESS